MKRIISFESPFSRLFPPGRARPASALTRGVLILSVAMLFTCLGCSDSDCPVCPSDCVDHVIITGNLNDLTATHYLIDSVRIEGKRIHLRTTVSGGCADHFYRLYVSDAFAESDPVQVLAYLVHESDDPCEAILHHNLEYDLQPLIDLYRVYYGEIGPIIINVYPNSDKTGQFHRVQFNP